MDSVDAFLHYLQYEKRYSSHTTEAYRSDLFQFISFLEGEGLVGDQAFVEADASIVRVWLMQMIESGIKPRSVNRKITALKAFYRFNLGTGKLSYNPMLKVVAPKVPKQLPEHIEAAKLDHLLDQIEFEEGYNGELSKLVLELLYGTGMRRAELIGLQLSDWESNSQQIRVTGKRNKQRIIPLFPSLANRLEAYIQLRLRLNSTSDKLLIREDGTEIYPEWVYRLVRKYLGMVSTKQKRSPHVLRHSFATEMLNNGADLNAIKEVLGHANLSATQVYTHNSLEKLKSVYKNAHPRGTRK